MSTQGLGVRNENGKRFLEFCQHQDLTIEDTLFIHRYTLNIYSMVSLETKSSTLQSIPNGVRRCLTFENVEAQISIVVTEMRLKVAARPAGGNDMIERRFEVAKLVNPDTTIKFRLEQRNRFTGLNGT